MLESGVTNIAEVSRRTGLTPLQVQDVYRRDVARYRALIDASVEDGVAAWQMLKDKSLCVLATLVEEGARFVADLREMRGTLIVDKDGNSVPALVANADKVSKLIDALTKAAKEAESFRLRVHKPTAMPGTRDEGPIGLHAARDASTKTEGELLDDWRRAHQLGLVADLPWTDTITTQPPEGATPKPEADSDALGPSRPQETP